jgi:CheY-like chemotaxis protein
LSDRTRIASSQLVNDHARGATILIAEDDEPLRTLLRMLLDAQGYQVLVAPDGKKALEIAGQHTGKIDLLLSDVVMPEMSGVELAKTLQIVPKRFLLRLPPAVQTSPAVPDRRRSA